MSGPIALRKLLTDAARSVPNAIILLHPTQAELAGGFGPEADQIEVIATGAGVQVVRMNDTLSGSADRAYRDADPMHINKIGQDIYARRMVDIAEEMLSRSDRL